MPEPCLWLLANSRPARSWSNPPPSAAGGLLLTGVCRPVTGVMRWNARPDGSDEEAGGRGFTLDATVTGVGSGVNGDRVTLRKGLGDPLAGAARGIIVVNPDGARDDVVRDMTRGRGRRCVLAGLVAGLLVAARRRVS